MAEHEKDLVFNLVVKGADDIKSAFNGIGKSANSVGKQGKLGLADMAKGLMELSQTASMNTMAMQKLKDQQGEYTKAIKDTDKSIKNEEKNIENTTKAIDNYSDKITKLKIDMDTFSNKIQESADKQKELKDKISELTQVENNNAQAKKRIEARLNSITVAGDTQSDVYKRLKDRLGELTKEEKENANAKAKLQKELEKVENSHRTYNDKLAKACVELDRLEKNEQESINKKKQSESAIDSLNGKLDKYKAKLEEINKAVDAEEESITGLKGGLKGLKDSFEEFSNGDFDSGFKKLMKSGKALFKVMPSWAKATVGLQIALNKLAKAGKQEFFTGLGQMKSVFSPLLGIASSISRSLISSFESVTDTDLSITGIANEVVGFEEALQRATVTAGATGAEIQAMENSCRSWGATTKYSGSDVANAMIEIASAGNDAHETMAMVGDVLHLASIENLDMARSAEIVSNTLNAFGLSAEQSSRVADVLAKTSVDSGTSVNQLGEALENAGAMAGSLKIPIEQVSAVLGLMGDKFIKSGKAGTSLKTFMANMAKPTKAMKEVLKDYNLETVKTKIVNGDLTGGLAEMADKIGKLDPQTQSMIATTLAGKEGVAGLLSVISEGSGKITAYADELKYASGSAKTLAEEMEKTLGGKLKNLASGLEERFIQIYDKIKNPLMSGIDLLTTFFNVWNGTSGMTDDRGIPLKGFTDAIVYLESHVKASMPKISKAIEDGIASIDDFIKAGNFKRILNIGGNIITSICQGIINSYEDGTLTSAISGAIKDVCSFIKNNSDILITAGQDIMSAISESVKANKEDINGALDEVIKVVSAWMDISTEWDMLWDEFGYKFVKVGLKKFWNGMKRAISEWWGNIKGDSSAMSKANQSGNAPLGEDAINNLLFGDWTIDDIKDWFKEKFKGFKLLDFLKGLIFGNKTTGKAEDSGNSPLGADLIFGDWNPIKDMEDWFKKTFGDWHPIQYIKDLLFSNKTKGKAEDSKGAIKAEDIFGNWNPVQDLKDWFDKTFGDFHPIQYIKDLLFSEVYAEEKSSGSKSSNAKEVVKPEVLFGDINPIEDIKEWWKNKFGDFNLVDYVKGLLFGNKTTGKAEDSGNNPITADKLFTGWNIVDDIKGWLDEKLTGFKPYDYIKEKFFSGDEGEAVDLLNIDTTKIDEVKEKLQSLSKTGEETSSSLGISFGEISKNITKARNTFTEKTISIYKVGSTQIGKTRQIITSKMMSIKKVISTKISEARQIFTSKMMSMASVARNQMRNAYSSVVSYMSKIKSAVNRSLNLKVNVSKTITTSYKNGEQSINALGTFNTLSAMARTTGIAPMSSVGLGTLVGTAVAQANNSNMSIEIPLYLDGKVIASATAQYIDGELQVINKRKNRKRGN